MKRYRSYKPSGIPWIGEIPEHWEIKRLKFLLQMPLQYGANEAAELDDPQLPRFVRITDIDDFGNLRDETFRSIPEEIAEPYLLEEGDILFARSGATVGKSFLYKKSWGRAAYAGYLIRARLKQYEALPSFIDFLTKSGFYSQWINSVLIQATIQNVSAEKYASFITTIPPLPEQESIAEYLNSKTAEISNLIAKKKRLIDLLNEEKTAIINHAVTKGLNPSAPMKKSGISWIGEIPAQWKLKKLKFLGDIKYGLGTLPKLQPNGLRLIRATDIQKGKLVDGEMVHVDPEDVPYDRDPVLKENDIIVVRSGAYTGDSAIIPREYEGSIVGYDMVARITRANAQFISYCLLSHYVLNFQIYRHRLRAAQPHLNREELGETLIVLPGDAEQADIVGFISTGTNAIQKTTGGIQQEIDLLQEYRTALINEAVTGKIDVRGAC